MPPQHNRLRLSRSIRDRPQPHHRLVALPVEPKLQRTPFKRLVWQRRPVITVQSRNRNLIRRVAKINFRIRKRTARHANTKIVRSLRNLSVYPSPLARRCIGVADVVREWDIRPSHTITGPLNHKRHRSRRPQNANSRNRQALCTVVLIRRGSRRRGASGLQQRAQVGVQHINRAQRQRDSALPLVQRHHQSLNTPELNTPVRKIRQD